jgi:hypothetical protein
MRSPSWPGGRTAPAQQRCCRPPLRSWRDHGDDAVLDDRVGQERGAELIDLGAGFPVASTTNVLTLYIAAPLNGTEVGIRVVEEVSGAVAEATITTDMPAAPQLLSPRTYLNNGTTAAAVAYDCSGVYVETDY